MGEWVKKGWYRTALVTQELIQVCIARGTDLILGWELRSCTWCSQKIFGMYTHNGMLAVKNEIRSNMDVLGGHYVKVKEVSQRKTKTV